MHSCRTIPLSDHFKNKILAKEIYDELLKRTQKEVGSCEEISLPCCIHWYGRYDFIALLPKKDKLEVRVGLNRTVKNSRIYTSVPMSTTSIKNCLFLNSTKEIDKELMEWIKESYFLK